MKDPEKTTSPYQPPDLTTVHITTEMKILILGAGKMGSFFCDLLSFDHEVAVYDPDHQRLRFTFNALRFKELSEIEEFEPQLVINASTVKYTLQSFEAVLPYLKPSCIISDIASVKTGLPEFYATCGHPFVSTHPMFGPTFASLSNLSNENAIIISEGDYLGKVFFRDLYSRLHLNIVEYTFTEHDETIAYSLSNSVCGHTRLCRGHETSGSTRNNLQAPHADCTRAHVGRRFPCQRNPLQSQHSAAD